MRRILTVSDVTFGGFKERVTVRAIDHETQAALRTVEIDRCGCLRVYDPSLPTAAVVLPCEACRA